MILKDASSQLVSEYHKRSGASHSEARKLMTGMAVGSLGVLYATLTGKDAPILDSVAKNLALGAVVCMALAVGFGLAAWRADAAWAYAVAQNFENHPGSIKPDEEPWHGLKKPRHSLKKWCDRLQLIMFAGGVLLAAILTFRLVY